MGTVTQIDRWRESAFREVAVVEWVWRHDDFDFELVE